MDTTHPTAEENDEFMLCCRYGDLEDVCVFIDKYGIDNALAVTDNNGNTPLHMCCANGHEDVLDAILSKLPSTRASFLSQANKAGSTALHWAALNSHLGVAQKLVKFPGGPGIELIDIRNTKGRTPLGEAAMNGWEEGARWFSEVMRVDEGEMKEDDNVPEEDTVPLDSAINEDVKMTEDET